MTDGVKRRPWRWNTQEKFWAKAALDDKDVCWPWRGTKNTQGYGWIRFQGGNWRAHRLAWVFTVGKIPEGMLVCHKCDNPSCCNPKHLFLGTHRDNSLDKYAKGRDNTRSKTHCKSGHPYDAKNTRFTKGIYRRCNPCLTRWQREKRQRMRLAGER